MVVEITKDIKKFKFVENKKGEKYIKELLKIFNLEDNIIVEINLFKELDEETEKIIKEYNLDVKISDLQLNASLMPDSHKSSGIQAYYYFAFVFDDLLIFKELSYIDLIKALEFKENKMPKNIQKLLNIYMEHWKKDFGNKFTLLRTEAITWATAVNQQLQVKFNKNEYFLFKLKCHASYLTLILMFHLRDLQCNYLEYWFLKNKFELFMFYINELASCLRERDVGELSSVDKLFMTSDFERITEYCVKQIYISLNDIDTGCNLMLKLEFLRLCKNTVFVHLASHRYERFYSEI
jgi:hypothetical protein